MQDTTTIECFKRCRDYIESKHFKNKKKLETIKNRVITHKNQLDNKNEELEKKTRELKLIKSDMVDILDEEDSADKMDSLKSKMTSIKNDIKLIEEEKKEINDKIRKIEENTIPQEDVQKLKNDVLDALLDIIICEYEADKNYNTTDYSDRYKKSYKKIEEAATFNELMEGIEDVMCDLQSYEIYYLRQSSYYNGYVEDLGLNPERVMDESNLMTIKNKLDIKQGITPNFLGYLIKNVDKLDTLIGENFSPYAIIGPKMEEDYRNQQIKDLRIAVGNSLGSKISNRVFDFMLVSEDYKVSERTCDFLNRADLSSLENSIKYVRKNGIVAFTLPFFRLYKDITNFISRNLYDVSIFRSNTFSFNGELIIMGRVKEDKKKNIELYKAIRNSMLETYEYNTDIIYTISNRPLEVQFFKGSILSKIALENAVNTSDAFEKYLASKKKDNSFNKEPLLPLSSGQLGLISTSGSIDGIIEEDENHAHVIRGKIKPHTRMVEEEDENGTITQESITSSHVQMNIITSDGGYKSII